MGVDQDRQETAGTRRRAIITALNDGFDTSDPTSPVSRFQKLALNPNKVIVANADIDGLLSAQMLSAATGWRVGALFDRLGQVRVAPGIENLGQLIDSGRAFGVDIFSTLFPGISNHPVFFGTTARTPAVVRDELAAFDTQVRSAVETHGVINLSAWVGIGALFGSRSPVGLPYKYPLGTAQLCLALLEAGGYNPRIYDRQFLPWMIANCDGGVDTIRTYAWNAETWWSALAAAVGPASHSEAIYRLVVEQRPNEFLDMDRRLRYDEPDRSKFLSTKWNLTSADQQALGAVSGLISDLSGWPDPFLGGSSDLDKWTPTIPTRNLMPLTGITKLPPANRSAHLQGALGAAHMNFSIFRERGTALGWSLAGLDEEVEDRLGSSFEPEDVPDDEPTIPDLVLGP